MAIISGAVKYVFDEREVIVNAGEVLVVPPNLLHWVVALEDSGALFFSSPGREDWPGRKGKAGQGTHKTSHC